MVRTAKYKEWNIYYGMDSSQYGDAVSSVRFLNSDKYYRFEDGGEVVLTKYENGGEKIYFRTYQDQRGTTKKKLIEIADEVGFKYDKKWSGIGFGRRLVKFLNEQGYPEVTPPKPQPEITAPDPQPEVTAPEPQPEVTAPEPQPEVTAPEPQPEVSQSYAQTTYSTNENSTNTDDSKKSKGGCLKKMFKLGVFVLVLFLVYYAFLR